ncbi:hypothetical protein [Streptomyces sp. NPDC021212]|uniref:SbtR family transcriptional regulator n=1 Tax=Streptomyces sp. NPDC021212 TaxID=3365118 RepID=UPI0037B7E290
MFGERGLEAPLEDPSPWGGFVGYVEGLFALQAEDRGLNDAIAQGFPAATELNEASRPCLRHTERVIERAKEGGRLRADFEPQDLAVLIWAMSQVIRQSMDTAPRAWRRCLRFFLDGLRADAAHSLAEPALTQGQMIRIVERSAARD